MRNRILAAIAFTSLAIAPVAVQAQVTVEAEVAEAIVDRMPQNPGTDFPAEVGQVSLWMRVTGASDSSVQVTWIHGEMEFPVTLQIGGSPWRTWSTKSIPPEWSGDWRAEVRDAEGNLLDTLSFTVGS